MPSNRFNTGGLCSKRDSADFKRFGALARADQYRKTVMGRFPKGVRVRVQVRTEKGKAVLDFKGIRVANVGKLNESIGEERVTQR